MIEWRKSRVTNVSLVKEYAVRKFTWGRYFCVKSWIIEINQKRRSKHQRILKNMQWGCGWVTWGWYFSCCTSRKGACEYQGLNVFQCNWRLGHCTDIWMGSCETWIQNNTEGYEAFQPVYMIYSDNFTFFGLLWDITSEYSLNLYIKFISKCFESVTV